MIPENERARRGKDPPIQNERPRGAAGILGEKDQHMLRRPTRSPRLRTICRVVVYARRNPARMNRRIISEFGRIAPKCSLICGKVRGGLPKQGGALRVRAPAAARDLRNDDKKAAERKERREPERGVEAHKLARWWEAPDEKDHHRRREGCCDLARTQAPPTPRGTRRDPPRRRYARAPAERRAQRATDNRADEHDVILAEQRREASPSRAEKRLPARRYAHTRRMKPRIERQLGTGNFPPKRRLGPKVFRLGAEKARPSKRRRNYVEKAALRELRAGVGAG